MTDGMRIYYAHAKPTYGTPAEYAEKRRIKARFTEYEIVDPGKHEGNIEKQRKGMKYCLRLIDSCDALIFSRWKNNKTRSNSITAGVGKEINYALSKRMPVYELRDGHVRSIHKPVAYLSIDTTMGLYSLWELKQRQNKAAKIQ